MSSKLQRYVSRKLSVHVGGYTIRENYRPEWLSTGEGGKLELDFFIEEMKIAIEVQGDQHFAFIPFFHGRREEFNKQRERDELKRRVCAFYGITLYEVCSRADFEPILYDLIEAHRAAGYITPEEAEQQRVANEKAQVLAGIYGKQPKPLTKQRIRKLLLTMVSYRNSEPEKLQEIYNELVARSESMEQVKNLAKRYVSVPPRDLPDYIARLWE